MNDPTGPPRKQDRKPIIAIVGPCGAGKTVLAHGLRRLGWNARQIAQEHSNVADMWQVLTRPDVLIYLEASFDVCTARKRFNWTFQEYSQQLDRLHHAREHSDIIVKTDDVAIPEVLRRVAGALERSHGTND